MPRTLATGIAAALAGPITEPIYLIQLNFSVVLRYSTAGDRSWNGYSWIGNGAALESWAQESGGRIRGRVSVPNADNSISAVVLGEGARGNTCCIWVADGTAVATDDPVQIFDGVMDACDIGLRVGIDIVSDQYQRAFLPRVVVAPPTFNHLPARGSTITWAGETYELERR